MDYSQIINALNHASAFDLYRLRNAIDNMIDEPKRLIAIKARLHLGQTVQWFNPSDNRVYDGTLIKIKQMRAVVSSNHDNRRWDIPLCAINTHHVHTSIEQPHKKGLTKNEIQIGERVGFVDKEGVEHSGEVIRLNQKTVTIVNHEIRMSWRVSYSLLHKVIEIDAK